MRQGDDGQGGGLPQGPGRDEEVRRQVRRGGEQEDHGCLLRHRAHRVLPPEAAQGVRRGRQVHDYGERDGHDNEWLSGKLM